MKHSAPPTSKRATFFGMVTQDPGLESVFRIVEKAAQSQASVLLRGETGTGKELLGADRLLELRLTAERLQRARGDTRNGKADVAHVRDEISLLRRRARAARRVRAVAEDAATAASLRIVR